MRPTHSQNSQADAEMEAAMRVSRTGQKRVNRTSSGR